MTLKIANQLSTTELARMIDRRHKQAIMRGLADAPAVVLLGPRQVGKTTIARDIAKDVRGSVYLDLEDPDHAARLANPGLYLDAHCEHMVILDEIQQMPNVFKVLRGQIDKRRRQGQSSGQFLLLGSAYNALLRQSAESLAGRVIYYQLTGLDALQESTILVDSSEPLEACWPSLWNAAPSSLRSKREAVQGRRGFDGPNERSTPGS